MNPKTSINESAGRGRLVTKLAFGGIAVLLTGASLGSAASAIPDDGNRGQEGSVGAPSDISQNSDSDRDRRDADNQRREQQRKVDEWNRRVEEANRRAREDAAKFDRLTKEWEARERQRTPGERFWNNLFRNDPRPTRGVVPNQTGVRG